MQSDFSKSLRFSRRHFFKAIAIAGGALGASLSGTARAQETSGTGAGGSTSAGSGSTNPWLGDPFSNSSSQSSGAVTPAHKCFLRGTLIRAGDAYRPVETLAVGDRLPTRFSGSAVIRKISSFRVWRDEGDRWPQDYKLVRIEAGALGENIPTRNLFVTDSHAVFLDGILIPIGSLVNGKNICFDEGAGRDVLEYFHLEFDAHDIIDAEGALCESRLGEGMEPCVPVVPGGGRSQLYSHLRSAIAPFVDLRQPHDLVRDRLEVRAGL